MLGHTYYRPQDEQFIYSGAERSLSVGDVKQMLSSCLEEEKRIERGFGGRFYDVAS